MRTRIRMLAIVGALALIATQGATALAQPVPSATGNATVSITSDTTTNFLAVSITNASFLAVPFSFVNQPTTGSLTVTATDTRGSSAGWAVTLNATDFRRSDNPAIAFDISNLNLNAGTLIALFYGGSMGSTVGIIASSAAPVQETGLGTTTIINSPPPAGSGQYELPMNGALNVPGGTLIGTYTSVVTVAIAAAP